MFQLGLFCPKAPPVPERFLTMATMTTARLSRRVEALQKQKQAQSQRLQGINNELKQTRDQLKATKAAERSTKTGRKTQSRPKATCPAGNPTGFSETIG